MFPTNSERLIGISDAFSAFVYGYPSSCPRAQCTPQQKRDCAIPAGMDLYIQAMPVGIYRVQSPGFLKIVYSAAENVACPTCGSAAHCSCTQPGYWPALLFGHQVIFGNKQTDGCLVLIYSFSHVCLYPNVFL